MEECARLRSAAGVLDADWAATNVGGVVALLGVVSGGVEELAPIVLLDCGAFCCRRGVAVLALWDAGCCCGSDVLGLFVDAAV